MYCRRGEGKNKIKNLSLHISPHFLLLFSQKTKLPCLEIFLYNKKKKKQCHEHRRRRPIAQRTVSYILYLSSRPSEKVSCRESDFSNRPNRTQQTCHMMCLHFNLDWVQLVHWVRGLRPNKSSNVYNCFT